MDRIIFYHPVALKENPTSGSELRPIQMLEAFKKEGFQIDQVVGTSKQRQVQIKKVRKQLQAGIEYAFMYAESATIPIPLADPHHLPLRPLQDVLFFSELKRREIPIGLFYRDVYWQVDELKYNGPWWKRLPKQAFLWAEWFAFRRFVDLLFLPTEDIQRLLPTPWPKEVHALPPGCSCNSKGRKQAVTRTSRSNKSLRLFYVGGVSPPYYDLRPLLDVVGELDNVHLTLCCREKEWQAQKHVYSLGERSDVDIVHAHSNEISRYYYTSDLVADLRKPEGYLKTALPIKVVEALGFGIPILLREGTAAASFVEREKTGWTVSSIDEAKKKISYLRDHHSEVEDRRQDIKRAQPKHTWQARAQNVASLLGGEI